MSSFVVALAVVSLTSEARVVLSYVKFAVK